MHVCKRLLALPATAALMVSCAQRPLECPTAASVAEVQRYFPQSLDAAVDLLFVIDNSNSMEDDQTKLATQFDKLIEALRAPSLGKDRPDGPPCTDLDRRNCKIPDVRIGVVSSDLGAGSFNLGTCERPGGDGGKLQSTPRAPGCTPPKDPWISYTKGVTNIPGDSTDPVAQVKGAFSCIARLGTGGCGFEHQLEAARRALDPKLQVNPGFLRPDALLAVVFITDEDDCSAARPDLFDPTQQAPDDPLGPLNFRCTAFGIVCDQPTRQLGPHTNCRPGGDYLRAVDDYAAFFRGLKPLGRAMLFAIAGPTTPFEVGLQGADPTLKASCQSTSADGSASGVPALRIAATVGAMGPDRGFFNRGDDEQGREIEVNICSSDFGPALRRIGNFIIGELGTQCVGGPVLTSDGRLACRPGDPLPDGTQCSADSLARTDCIVEDVPPDETEQTIARCPAELFDPAQRSCGASCPCWRLLPKPECKTYGAPYAVEVLREANREPAKGTVAKVRCASTLRWQSASEPLQCR